MDEVNELPSAEGQNPNQRSDAELPSASAQEPEAVANSEVRKAKWRRAGWLAIFKADEATRAATRASDSNRSIPKAKISQVSHPNVSSVEVSNPKANYSSTSSPSNSINPPASCSNASSPQASCSNSSPFKSSHPTARSSNAPFKASFSNASPFKSSHPTARSSNASPSKSRNPRPSCSNASHAKASCSNASSSKSRNPKASYSNASHAKASCSNASLSESTRPKASCSNSSPRKSGHPNASCSNASPSESSCSNASPSKLCQPKPSCSNASPSKLCQPKPSCSNASPSKSSHPKASCSNSSPSKLSYAKASCSNASPSKLTHPNKSYSKARPSESSYSTASCSNASRSESSHPTSCSNVSSSTLPRKRLNVVKTTVYEHISYSNPLPGAIITAEFGGLFSCGHYLELRYEPAEDLPEHMELFCPAPCMRVHPCGHRCKKICYEECGQCPLTTTRKFYDCEHSAVEMPCAVLKTDLDACQAPVDSLIESACGHNVQIPCSRRGLTDSNQIAKWCTATCNQEPVKDGASCRHTCQGSCNECQQGRFHVRCSQPCGRMLICHHFCTTPCSDACAPCKATCDFKCEHGPCPEECGYPCPACEEPCLWECPHQKCTRECGEVCDREPCNEPCPKKLPCGHFCVSYCGEPCPTLCAICDKDQLMAGLILSKDSLEETDRFVLLEDCGHSIERNMLDQWMNIQNSEIYHKACPLCGQVIHKCRRYIRILHATHLDVQKVKTRIYGPWPEFFEVQSSLCCLLRPALEFSRFPGMAEYVSQGLPCETVPLESIDYNRFNLHELKSLAYIAQIWHDVEVKLTELELHLDRKYVKGLDACYELLFTQIRNRQLPLRPLELRDFHRQLDRLDDMTQLYERKSSKLSTTTKYLIETPAATTAFDAALEVLWRSTPYDSMLREEFRVCLSRLDDTLKCTIGISNEERTQILGAIGLSIGRWFKCPNGHIYLITECGGATEVSNCSECGLRIGGENHQLLQGNRLATEMDGALLPAYPGTAGI